MKQKGTLAETALVNYLQEKGIDARRLPLVGAKDQGDILISREADFTVEVKNHRTMDLAEWVDQSITERDNAKTDFGVVMHKRIRRGNPGDWYVTMSVDTFIGLLKRL